MSRLVNVARHFWRDLVHRSAVNAELDEELASYVQIRVDQHVQSGMSPEAARREAFAEIGGTAWVTEAIRDTRRTATVEMIIRDIRFAVRTLLRTPAFSATTVVILALGIGGATAVLSVVDTVLMRPAPGVRDPATLVSLDRLEDGVPNGGFGFPDYDDYQKGVPAVQLAAAVSTPLGMTTSAKEPQQIRGALVTGNYFGVLGVHASAGRLLSPANDSDHAPVVVISYGLWQRAFGAAPSAIGAIVSLGGHPFTILGVTEREFGGAELGEQIDVWAPLSEQPILMSRMSANVMQNRSAGWLSVFGRLRPGATFAGTQSQIELVTARLAVNYPITNHARSARLRPGTGLSDEDRRELQHLLGLMTAAALLFLILACANVAGLLIVRAQGREREMAVRLALGAGFHRIAGQLFIEAALLACTASLLSAVMTPELSRLGMAAQPTVSLLRRVDVVWGPRVFAAVAVVTVLVTVAIVLVPMVRLSGLAPMGALRHGRTGASAAGAQSRRVLVGVQVAVSFGLLSASTLVGLAVNNLRSRDPGYDRASLVMLNVNLAAQGYTPAQGLHFYNALLDRLSLTTMFESASFAKTVPPLDWSDGLQIFRAEEDPPAAELRTHATLGLHVYGDPVAPGFFKTLGVRLLAGREFTAQDDATAPQAAVVNAALAKRLWPTRSAIGQRIAWPAVYGDGPSRLLEVVGVVPDFRYTSLTAVPSPTLFYPILQDYDGRATLIARSNPSARNPLRELGAVVHAVDPGLPITGEQTMPDRMAASVWQQQLLAGWLGVVGLLALVLAFVGLYGVIAQVVGQREHELALRLALGASPRRMIGAIVGEGTVVMLCGLMAGFPVALFAVTRVEGQLEGMHADPMTAISLAIGVIAAAMLLATVLPARRAARLDPVDALRVD